MRSGRLGGLSGLEPIPNLLAICAPLASVGRPITVGGLLGVLQVRGDFSQVDTLLGGVVSPRLADGLAPGSPFFAGGIGSEERRENRTLSGEGLASDVGIVVLLPLGSVFLPGPGCKGEPNRQN